MRLKIVANGKPYGTRVLNAETGDELAMVRQVAIRCDPEDSFVPVATIEVEIEMDAEVVAFIEAKKVIA